MLPNGHKAWDSIRRCHPQGSQGLRLRHAGGRAQPLRSSLCRGSPAGAQTSSPHSGNLQFASTSGTKPARGWRAFVIPTAAAHSAAVERPVSHARLPTIHAFVQRGSGLKSPRAPHQACSVSARLSGRDPSHHPPTKWLDIINSRYLHGIGFFPSSGEFGFDTKPSFSRSRFIHSAPHEAVRPRGLLYPIPLIHRFHSRGT